MKNDKTYSEWENQPCFDQIRSMPVTGNCDVCKTNKATRWFKLTSVAICNKIECGKHMQDQWDENERVYEEEDYE
jgi:Zn ribbon nucleic-acid-binding protein